MTTTRQSRHVRISGAFAALVLCLSLVGCGGRSPDPQGVSAGDGGPDELFAESASFEVVAAKPQRVMVGLSTADGRVLHGGSVEFAFTLAEGSNGEPITSEAAYLPVPGSQPLAGAALIGRPSEGIGVYAAEGVTLPNPGIWLIDVREAGTGKQLAQTAVEVLDRAKAPDVGDPAPPTDNPTAASPVARELLDSRSGPNGMGDELADPALHRDVINALLRDHRPFVVVASTPAYCQSRFCGPVTDMIDAIATEPDADALGVAFVHLEVYAEFGGAGRTKLNPWVVPWIDGSGEGHEPWIFVVDRAGTITARFDNLVDEQALRDAIAAVAAN